MYGLAVIEVISLTGHLANIDEIKFSKMDQDVVTTQIRLSLSNKKFRNK